QFRKFISDGQFVPLRTDRETVVFPGFDGGAEWGGQAFDPDTGLLYVNANDVAWTSSLAEDHGGASPRHTYQVNCANCHGDDPAGAPPQIPPLVALRGPPPAQQITPVIRQGAGRMPAFPNLSSADVRATAEYVLSGESKELVSSAAPEKAAAYRFTGYHK